MHNYIIARGDQDPTQIVLQAIHAALVCRAVPDEDALVFLLAKNEKELVALADLLEDDLHPYRYSEDDGVVNAVAFRGVHDYQRKHFRKLEKWCLPLLEMAA